MNKNFKRNSALILTGLAAGVVAGMLLAPRSGRETRSSIKRGARGGFDRGASLWRRLRGRHEQPTSAMLDDEVILSGR